MARKPYIPCPECGERTNPSAVLPNMVKCGSCGKLSIAPKVEKKPAALGDEFSLVEFTVEGVTVPDVSEVIVAWRAWGVSEALSPVLESATWDAYWPQREVLEAECSRSHLCHTPGDECACGLYAAKTREHLLSLGYQRYDAERNGEYSVMGTVSLWGKVVEGTQGWRAQYGYPRELFVPYEAWSLAKPLKRAYGVPVHLDNILA